MDKKEIGLKRMQEILGSGAEKIVENFESISPDFAKYVVELAYGDFYARPGITDKHREIAIVSCLIGQGNTGFPLKSHLKGMLNVGHTKEDIIELLIFLIPCTGFPNIVGAIATAQELFDEQAKAA